MVELTPQRAIIEVTEGAKDTGYGNRNVYLSKGATLPARDEIDSRSMSKVYRWAAYRRCPHVSHGSPETIFGSEGSFRQMLPSVHPRHAVSYTYKEYAGSTHPRVHATKRRQARHALIGTNARCKRSQS